MADEVGDDQAVCCDFFGEAEPGYFAVEDTVQQNDGRAAGWLIVEKGDLGPFGEGETVFGKTREEVCGYGSLIV